MHFNFKFLKPHPLKIIPRLPKTRLSIFDVFVPPFRKSRLIPRHRAHHGLLGVHGGRPAPGADDEGLPVEDEHQAGGRVQGQPPADRRADDPLAEL